MTVLVNQLITDGLKQSAITQRPVVDPGGAAFNHRITHPDALVFDPVHSPVSAICVNETKPSKKTHTYANHP